MDFRIFGRDHVELELELALDDLHNLTMGLMPLPHADEGQKGVTTVTSNLGAREMGFLCLKVIPQFKK